MDPYAGIMVGPDSTHEDAPWFLDFGMGPLGSMAAWFGLSIASGRMNQPHKFMKNLAGKGRIPRDLRSTLGFPDFKTGLWPSHAPGSGVGSEIYRDVKGLVGERGMLGRKMGGKNLNWRLWKRAKSQGYSLTARYGGELAGRIGFGAALQGTLGVLEVMGGLYFGAAMVEGLANTIADWEPAPATGPQVQFGDEQNFYMPRAATTQRMRALQAIHNSQLTTRAALGNEAVHLHN